MALSEDVTNQPIHVTNSNGTVVSSITTATFTIPAGSFALALCSYAGGSVGQTTPTFEVEDSSGNAWTQLPNFEEQGGCVIAFGCAAYYTYTYAGITVTFKQTANIVAGDMALVVRLLDGSAGTGAIGATGQNRSSFAVNHTTGITPTTLGSYIYCVTASGNEVNNSWTMTPTNISSLIYNREDTSTTSPGSMSFAGQAAGRFNPVTSTSPMTIGWTFPSGYECGFATFAVEIVPGVTPVTVNLAVAQVNVAAPKVVPIVGAGVSLTTGRVAVSAPPPTVTASRITSGGVGSTGSISITYISPQTQALASSLSPIATTDPYGNAVPVGYMGPVSAIQPGSSPSQVETWHGPLALTNASASGNGCNGFWYRYRSDNTVELLWDITLGSTASNICTLPSGYVPHVTQNIPSSWYGTGPAGYSSTFSPAMTVTSLGVISVSNCNGLTISLCGRYNVIMDAGV